MPRIEYHLRTSDEDRKQLYWGAFMLGSAAFHQHRKAGHWLDEPALETLALRRFERLATARADEDLPSVDDQELGRRWFRDGFTAGYRQRADRMGREGLERQRECSPLNPMR